MISIKLKYKNMEDIISIESSSYIGELVEKAISKFNTFIFAIEDIYCHYENNEFIKLGRDTKAIFKNKISDIINDSCKCKMIVLLERKRDIHNNVVPNTLPELYDSYQQLKRDEEMARSLNNRYERIDNIYTNILQTFETIGNTPQEETTQEGTPQEGTINEDSTSNNQASSNTSSSGLNRTASVQPSIETFMSNIQESLSNNNTSITFTTEPLHIESNIETIASSTLNELSTNIMNSLSSNNINNSSNTSNIFNSIIDSITTGLNNNNNDHQDIKVTMKEDENKELRYMKYKDLSEKYCSTNCIVKTSDCTICLENFQNNDDILITECNHLFHFE